MAQFAPERKVVRVTILRDGRHAGFGRLDLMAVLAVLLGFVALLSAIIFRLHHPSAQIRCANNLRELGVAMALYEEDSDERVPYAYIKTEKDGDQNSRAWDQLIFSLIPLNSAGLQQKHLFRCPADTIARSGDRPQRTYAMPIHTMAGDTWPPGPDNSTGVGLFWEAGRGGLADVTNVISPQATVGDKPKSSIPAVRLGMIPAPSETLLLTENARPANILFTPSAAGISGPGQHVQSRLIDIDYYHAGRINYLMIDGHVEFLHPWESAGLADPNSSVSKKSHANVWTIRADD
jgi:prepilin-type processing-associated H-X9-DG protein